MSDRLTAIAVAMVCSSFGCGDSDIHEREGKRNVKRMYDGARAFYMDQNYQKGMQFQALPKHFPGAASPSRPRATGDPGTAATIPSTTHVGPTPPLGTCCAQGGKCSPDPSLWTDEIWVQLQFSVDDPHYYSYEYIATSDGSGFTARAIGDPDCDGDYDTFEMYGTINAQYSDGPAGSAGIYRNNELDDDDAPEVSTPTRATLTDSDEDHLSTFAADVDTASYTLARRTIREGRRPSPGAVRAEEWINYFDYGYPAPTDDRPFAVHIDAAPSPFAASRTLLRVGIQAKRVPIAKRKPVHLVFLVDVSGSMATGDKLPLAQRALGVLVDNLREVDTVALVTYAGSTRVVLEPTGIDQRGTILEAIENLRSGGGTAMGDGVQLAYGLAARQLAEGSISRVIVLSDGDANVGPTSHEEILKLIEGHAKEGVTLTTIGFGMGNYRDDLMEQLADKGNGNNFYIDGMNQARRVFQQQLGGTLEVVAKDLKIQVDINPELVEHYRLIGYDNRAIADRDFRNDRVDAGELGAGHTVTAFYELELSDKHVAGPFATVRLRAKRPRGENAIEYVYEHDPATTATRFERAAADFRFGVAVMAAAEVLSSSPHAAGWSLKQIEEIAADAGIASAADQEEFISLVRGVR